MAYIWLSPQGVAEVAESVPLADFAADAGVETLHDLILDFDAKGRLLGHRSVQRQERALQSLLDSAERI
jgi:hypothetical protein